MALDPKLLDSMPNTLVDMYSLAEIDILKDMARSISTYDFLISAVLHQNQKLQKLGITQQHIIEALTEMTGQTQKELVALLTEASEITIKDDTEYYKTAGDVYEPSKINTEALHKQLNNGLLQIQQAFKNITRTTANTATKQFENALDRAWTQINVGGMDYNTAIRRAIEDLSDNGIGAIQYKSGRIDSLEVAVRRATVTGVNQTAIKTQEALADELGVELVEVTAHGGARPSHAKWQGKCFSRNGRQVIDGVVYEDLKKATGYGSAGGLCGVNCRHSFRPYIHGTARAWSDKQLKDLDKKDIEYNGEKYTEYEASQIQREIEKDIRKQKRKIAALEVVGEDASEYRAKLRKSQKAYTNFTEQTGLKKQTARTKVATGTGIETSAPNKTAEEEKKSVTENKLVKSLEFAVSKQTLQKREYANKFNSITDDKDERKEFLKNAKEILNHRSGQNGEDLYLYNQRLKKWYKSTSGTKASTPEYTQEILDGISQAKDGELIAFHNHPASMPPSDADLNAALTNKYSKGYTLCHNGKVFKYTAPKIPIDSTIYEKRLAKYIKAGYNNYEAQIETLQKLAELYEFTFKEV